MVYAAFLRAINLGSHNRIRMEELRVLVAGLGYEGVRTYLHTGNVVLRADEGAGEVARRLEGALAEAGLRNVDAMVRSRAELRGLAADADPFAPYPAEEHRHLAIFTREPLAEPETLPYEARGVTFVSLDGAAALAVIRRDAPRPVNANAVVESLWKTRATTRWWNVVEELRRDLLA
jgi:uncharacterized protein (DUF1697 family)